MKEIKRLDYAIAQAYSITRSMAKNLILEGKVMVDGIVISVPKYSKYTEDSVFDLLCESVPSQQKNDIILEPDFIDFKTIYEDDYLLIIDKQKGLVVHPGQSVSRETIVNGLIYKYGDTIRSVGSHHRPGIVHRLDKNTTGLMVIAKTQLAFDALSEMIREKSIVRKYIALCYGVPRVQSGIIQTQIGKDPLNHEKQKILIYGGKEAITYYSVLQTYRDKSLIEFELKTGRTHQIRVHSLTITSGIIGDDTYFTNPHNVNYTLEGQMLHSYFISFLHPITGDLVSRETEIPEYFQAYINKIT